MGAYKVSVMIELGEILRLGRFSNLPTVWSNVLAATALSAAPLGSETILIMGAVSLLYTGGMFLNDACDLEHDKIVRPSRPLPSGRVPVAFAWTGGGILLVAGCSVLAYFGTASGLAGIALAGAVLSYNAWHRDNPLAPVIMGACRAIVYIVTALALSSGASDTVVLGAVVLLIYVVALTILARDETENRIDSRWAIPLLFVPAGLALTWAPIGAMTLLSGITAASVILLALWRVHQALAPLSGAVGTLIAVIALNDAALASSSGSPQVGFLCFGCFALTLAAQRYVPGS
ncbi:MAG: UbiA family prenyltransferase [Hyphomicrobium sp.]|nr:UbiA family prenyltransferase [Hyphomicrobium sp.]